MKPVSPVFPESKLEEIVLAKDQPEYTPLPVVVTGAPLRTMYSRWRFAEEDRLEIAAGADLVLSQLTFGNPFQPISVQIVGQDQDPVEVGLLS